MSMAMRVAVATPMAMTVTLTGHLSRFRHGAPATVRVGPRAVAVRLRLAGVHSPDHRKPPWCVSAANRYGGVTFATRELGAPG